MKSDPKTFWNLLNKLSSERIQDESFNQTEFIKFFQNLNLSSENIPNNEFHDNIIQKLKHLKGSLSASNSDDEFNVPIKSDEILKVIKTLKNGKSAAIDSVSNEMIKYGMPLLLEPLTKLFNLIFMKGTFPKAWNESFITLIHKKGNKYDNSNYRGISITSNLGKLFNKIIHA
jgi:hypothetical protein